MIKLLASKYDREWLKFIIVVLVYSMQSLDTVYQVTRCIGHIYSYSSAKCLINQINRNEVTSIHDDHVPEGCY